MRERKKGFTGSLQNLRKMKQIQEAAAELVVTHLDPCYRRLPKAKGGDLVTACAFIMFGYHILRARREESIAADTFDALAHFSRLGIEEGRARAKASKMH